MKTSLDSAYYNNVHSFLSSSPPTLKTIEKKASLSSSSSSSSSTETNINNAKAVVHHLGLSIDKDAMKERKSDKHCNSLGLEEALRYVEQCHDDHKKQSHSSIPSEAFKSLSNNKPMIYDKNEKKDKMKKNDSMVKPKSRNLIHKTYGVNQVSRNNFQSTPSTYNAKKSTDPRKKKSNKENTDARYQRAEEILSQVSNGIEVNRLREELRLCEDRLKESNCYLCHAIIKKD